MEKMPYRVGRRHEEQKPISDVLEEAPDARGLTHEILEASALEKTPEEVAMLEGVYQVLQAEFPAGISLMPQEHILFLSGEKYQALNISGSATFLSTLGRIAMNVEHFRKPGRLLFFASTVYHELQHSIGYVATQTVQNPETGEPTTVFNRIGFMYYQALPEGKEQGPRRERFVGLEEGMAALQEARAVSRIRALPVVASDTQEHESDVTHERAQSLSRLHTIPESLVLYVNPDDELDAHTILYVPEIETVLYMLETIAVQRGASTFDTPELHDGNGRLQHFLANESYVRALTPYLDAFQEARLTGKLVDVREMVAETFGDTAFDELVATFGRNRSGSVIRGDLMRARRAKTA